MKPKSALGHDGFVTKSSINSIKDEINCGKLQQLVCDLITKEPDLGVMVSFRFQKFIAMLHSICMSDEQRAMLDRHVCLTIWVPLIALARAHRDAWDDVLPEDLDSDSESATVTEAP